MKQIEITTQTKTSVSYNGIDVNELLRNICDSFHFILYECSTIKDRIENGGEINTDTLCDIEGTCCEMLDLLND